MKSSFKNNLPVIFLFVTVFILGLPLAIYGMDKMFFYTTDPDVVYITNAILYTKYHIISYADHPGTPTITFLYLSFIPLRILAKYVYHFNFLQWTFDNYIALTFYSRILQLGIFGSAIYVFLMTIKKITKSRLIIILAWLSIVSFAGIGLSISIAPENLSLLLASSWIFLFSLFISNRSYLFNGMLVFISAFAVANKLTNVFLLIPSLLLPLFVKKLKFDQKIIRFQINLLVAWFSFKFGVYPAINKLVYMKNFATALLNHPGPYGTGHYAIFDAPAYLSSVSALIRESPIMFGFICLNLLLMLYILIKRKLEIHNPVLFLNLFTILGIVVFAKYPFVHYNYINIVILIFCTCYLLTKMKQIVVEVLIFLLIASSIVSIGKYFRNIDNRIDEFNKDNAYASLESWTLYWSNDLFREQFNTRLTKP